MKIATFNVNGITARLPRLLEALAASGDLDGYPLLHAGRADLLRRLGRGPEAATAYRRALELSTNPVEQALLTRRLAEVAQP